MARAASSTPARGSATATAPAGIRTPGCRRVTSAAVSTSWARPWRPRAVEGAGDEASVGRPDGQAAGGHEQARAGLGLERLPRGVGALHERHVERVLEVGLADDAGAALRRAAGVRQRELLEADDPPAAPGQLGERRGPHRAQADHDRVVEHAATIQHRPRPGAAAPGDREGARLIRLDRSKPMSTPPTWPPPPPPAQPPPPPAPPAVPGAAAALRAGAAAEEVVGRPDRGDPDRRGLRRHLRGRHHRGDRHPGAPAGAHERQRSRGDRHRADHGERGSGLGERTRRALRPAGLPRRAGELRRHADARAC